MVESEDEIKELNHKLKVKIYEVEQLKEDMTIKENMLVKGEFGLCSGNSHLFSTAFSFSSFAKTNERKGKHSNGAAELIERVEGPQRQGQ